MYLITNYSKLVKMGSNQLININICIIRRKIYDINILIILFKKIYIINNKLQILIYT